MLKNKTVLLVTAITVLMLSPALAAEGAIDPAAFQKALSSTGDWGAGNGGDGIRKGNEIVLRDFYGEITPVANNKEFVESAQDFLPLLTEIAQVHPEFAVGVWGQLMSASFWVTEKPLNLLPSTQTGMTDLKADEQIGYREGDHILISLPGYRQTTQSYLLLHEAIHGMISGNGAFKHMRVRSVVKYFRDNRGKYDRKQMEQLFKQVEIGPWNLDHYIHRTSLTQETVRSAISLLFRKEGYFHYRCYILELLMKSGSRFYDEGIRHLKPLKSWDDYSNCPLEDPDAHFLEKNPELKEYADQLDFRELYFIPTQYTESTLRRRCDRSELSPERERLQRSTALLQAAKKGLDRAMDGSVWSDESERLYMRLALEANVRPDRTRNPDEPYPRNSVYYIENIPIELRALDRSWKAYHVLTETCAKLPPEQPAPAAKKPWYKRIFGG